MKKKIIKNSEAPKGRIDNLGRTERVRLSLTEDLALMLKEVLEHFRDTKIDQWTEEYQKFYEDVLIHIEQLHQNLLVEIDDRTNSLF